MRAILPRLSTGILFGSTSYRNVLQLGDRQFPAVANSCRPIANCSSFTGTQYTTRARDLKFPRSDLTLRRSFGFQGFLVSTRAPLGLTFSVIPSCAGVRISKLDKSTVTFIGVRSSARFTVSIGHREADGASIHFDSGRKASRQGATTPASYLSPRGSQDFLNTTSEGVRNPSSCPPMRHLIPRADSPIPFIHFHPGEQSFI